MNRFRLEKRHQETTKSGWFLKFRGIIPAVTREMIKKKLHNHEYMAIHNSIIMIREQFDDEGVEGTLKREALKRLYKRLESVPT